MCLLYAGIIILSTDMNRSPIFASGKKSNVTTLHLYTFWRKNKFNVMREKISPENDQCHKKDKISISPEKLEFLMSPKNSIMLLVGRQTV